MQKKKLANNFISITTIKKQTCLLMWVSTTQLERGGEGERERAQEAYVAGGRRGNDMEPCVD